MVGPVTSSGAVATLAAPAAGRTARLTLPPAASLHASIAAAMDGVLGYAAEMLQVAKRRPAVAVHEYRKSLRRARALLALVRPLLAPRTARTLANVLGTAHRATSRLRDSDVLLAVMRALEGRMHIGRRARAFLGGVAALLVARRRRLTADVAASALARHLPAVIAVVPRLTRALPKNTDWGDLEEGLCISYRRARRCFLLAKRRHRRDEPFHDWRKRTKTVNYQLELLASADRSQAEKLRRRCAGLAETQGNVTDLMILRDHILSARTASKDGVARKLCRRIDRLIDKERRRVLDAAKALFLRSPRKWAEKVLA